MMALSSPSTPGILLDRPFPPFEMRASRGVRRADERAVSELRRSHGPRSGGPTGSARCHPRSRSSGLSEGTRRAAVARKLDAGIPKVPEPVARGRETEASVRHWTARARQAGDFRPRVAPEDRGLGKHWRSWNPACAGRRRWVRNESKLAMFGGRAGLPERSPRGSGT